MCYHSALGSVTVLLCSVISHVRHYCTFDVFVLDDIVCIYMYVCMCVACDTKDGSSIPYFAHQRDCLRSAHIRHDIITEDQIEGLHGQRGRKSRRGHFWLTFILGWGLGETASDFFNGYFPVLRFVTGVEQGGEYPLEHGPTDSRVLYDQHVTLLWRLN